MFCKNCLSKLLSYERYAKVLVFYGTVSVLLLACDKPTPEELRLRQHLPRPDFVANVVQGNSLYDANCTGCHGVVGTGTRQGPPLVHKTYRSGHHSDMVFHRAIKDGVQQHHWKFGNMPPQSHVTPEMAGHIVAYIRQAQHKAGIK